MTVFPWLHNWFPEIPISGEKGRLAEAAASGPESLHDTSSPARVILALVLASLAPCRSSN